MFVSGAPLMRAPKIETDDAYNNEQDGRDFERSKRLLEPQLE